MELITCITMLCICLSSMQSPCAAALQIQVQQSHDQQAYNNEVQLSLPTLTRKLRVLLTSEVKEHAVENKMSRNNPKEDAPAGDTNGIHRKEQGGGRWQEEEWVVDRSQYFTMDYSAVRRRRPIHNKSLPAAP